MTCFRELVSILELLILSLVLLEHINKLQLFLLLLLGLLTVDFHLLGELFRLFVDLASERVFNGVLLGVLILHLLRHQLNLLVALLGQVDVLLLQVLRLLLDQVVLFF